MKRRIIVAFLLSGARTRAASLKGSPASLERQNEEAERSELSYLEDDEALERMIKNGYLVPIQVSSMLTVDKRLDPKWHYVRPWTARFLTDLSSDFYERFKEPLQINSAVRTLKRQKELQEEGNGNAAPLDGKRRSPHPTGAAIDIAKFGRTGPQIRWLALRLTRLEREGVIEATEEHRQAVFHVMVFKKYLDRPQKKTAKDRKRRP